MYFLCFIIILLYIERQFIACANCKGNPKVLYQKCVYTCTCSE